MKTRIRKILDSPLRSTFEEVRRLRREGRPIIEFTAGEPSWEAPQNILCEVSDWIRENPCYGYPPARGILELRELIAMCFQKRTGRRTAIEDVIVTNGAKQAIKAAMMAVLNPKDEVMIFSPYYPSYVVFAHLASSRPLILKSEVDFIPDVSAVKKMISGRCKMIIVNTPCNPTGAVYPKDILTGICELAIRHQCYVLFDECYRRFIYDGDSHFSPAGMDGLRDLLISVDSFSKSYAMAGWRLGYAIAPRDVIRDMALLIGEETSGVNIISQRAGISALSMNLDMSSVLRRLKENRDYLYDELSTIEGVDLTLPGGAFYLFPKVKKLCRKYDLKSADDLLGKILDSGAAAIPGRAFGSADSIRLSYCMKRGDLERGVQAIKDALQSLESV